jgi:hypothetical protein
VESSSGAQGSAILALQRATHATLHALAAELASLDLTSAVDMDRSTVIDHATKGTQPWPATVKKYADAFTKALHRSISPAELMVDVVKSDPK